MFLSVLVLSIIVTNKALFSDPSPEEIRNGYEVPASESWGQQMRIQNSLRILCVGGSNTAFNEDDDGIIHNYVHLLDQTLKDNLSFDEHFRNHSYALNEGVSGTGISFFTGRRYHFELLLEPYEWPNVVIIDTAVNWHHTYTNVTLERFVRYIDYKYKLVNLRCPDFLFYNMPHLYDAYQYSHSVTSEKDRVEYAKTYLSHDRFYMDQMIRQFAAHYRIPVISWGNATFAAAMRHFVNSSFDGTQWKYSHDGIHMSLSYGTQFGVDKLLLPFFKECMKSKVEVPFEDFNVMPRLVPPGPVLLEQLSYSSYGQSVDMFPLSDIVVTHRYSNNTRDEEDEVEYKSWEMRPIAHNEMCYSSTDINSLGELRFNVPVHCNRVNCLVQLGFIHSWNSSYIGNTTCSLFKHEQHEKHSNTLLAHLHINGQDRCEGATIPVLSTFSTNVVHGLHTIHCKNLLADRLSCLVEVLVNAVAVV